MSQKNIYLAWDINKSHVIIDGIKVFIAPQQLAPFQVGAVVEEQDTALILSKPAKIPVTDDKPGWLLANELESQTLLEPGSVLIRDGQTMRMLAIVHDLEQQPSWRTAWIAETLDNIFNISLSYGITSIQLPVLGAEYGRFNTHDFLHLLVNTMKKHHGIFEKIWLLVAAEEYPHALSILKDISNANENKNQTK